MTPDEAAEKYQLRNMIEESERRTSGKIEDLDRRVDARLHEHGKHISRIEGQMTEYQIRMDERHAAILGWQQAQTQAMTGLGNKMDLAREENRNSLEPIKRRMYTVTGAIMVFVFVINNPSFVKGLLG